MVGPQGDAQDACGLVPEPGKNEMVERRNPVIIVKASCESYPGTGFFVKFAELWYGSDGSVG